MIRVFALAGLSALAVSAHAQTFQAGNWEARMKMEVMGQTMNEAMTDCMGPQEAAQSPRDIAADFAGGANCTASNIVEGPNSVSFRLDCPGEAMRGADLRMDYQPTAFTMTGDVTIAVSETQTVPAKMTVNAKRIGVCTGG